MGGGYHTDPNVCVSQGKEVPAPQSIENAHVLLFLGNNVTTDHISPAGSIARVSAAAKYLLSKRSVLGQASGLEAQQSGKLGFFTSKMDKTHDCVRIRTVYPRSFQPDTSGV